jgi:hypothetical protein
MYPPYPPLPSLITNNLAVKIFCALRKQTSYRHPYVGKTAQNGHFPAFLCESAATSTDGQARNRRSGD